MNGGISPSVHAHLFNGHPYSPCSIRDFSLKYLVDFLFVGRSVSITDKSADIFFSLFCPNDSLIYDLDMDQSIDRWLLVVVVFFCFVLFIQVFYSIRLFI